MLQNTKKRASRRAWPIHGYVGANGGGKSAAMVWDTLPSLLAGRCVLSTVRLLDWENPRECDGNCDDPSHEQPIYAPVEADWLVPESEREVVGHRVHMQAHPGWIKFREWPQILEARGVDVLLDEVTGVASSRESAKMPAPVANALVQLRRSDVVVRWSTPAWTRADIIIRECSQAVTYCRGFMPTLVQDHGADRAWRTRRLFKWKTYDAADFEDFTAGKREQLAPLTVDWHYGPKSPVFSAYDTFDAVASIGSVTETGRCYRCDGTRKAHECVCTDYLEHVAEVKEVRANGGITAATATSPGKRKLLALAAGHE